jgi:hypothetical protein
VIWGALSLRELLPPRVEGLVLAALGIFGGFEMMAFMNEPQLRWPLWLGALACAALVYGGSRISEMGVLGIGAVGLTVYSGQLVGEYLGFGAGTAIALIVVGFVLLGACIRLTLRMAADATQDRRVASEVAGYLGIALAMGGAGVLLGQYWDELGVVGHVLVPLAGAVVAYGSALLLERSDSGSARRLSQTLLAIGVLASAVTAAMVAQPIAENAYGSGSTLAANWTMLAGSVAATLVGGVTWWLRKGSLTQIAFIAGLAANVIAALNFAGPEPTFPFWVFGAVLVSIGSAWVALGATERMVPVRTALAAGSVVVLQGLTMMTNSDAGYNTWAAVLGIGFGVAGIALSIALKRAILLGCGAVAIVMFSMTTVMEEFGNRVGAPILLLVMGVVFIAVAVVAAKAAPRARRMPKAA